MAKTGSFAGAAEEVALTQAAVSLQMRTLEDELKQPLFDRSARQVKLSRHGRVLLPKVEQILTLVGELYADPVDAMQGPVTIGAVVSVIGALSIAVAALKTAHPLLDVRLQSARSEELTAMVERGDVDIAAVVAHPDDPLSPQLSWTTLYSEPMVLLVHKDLLGTVSATEADPREILDVHGFLRFDRRVRTGILVDQTLARLGLTTREYLELNSIDTIVTLIRKKVGVAVLPQLHGADWQDDPELRIVPLNSPTVPTQWRTVGVIQRAAFARRGITGSLIAQLHGGESPG